ncbi:hypothetical protein RB195_015287 [Necator americanus]|uniref:Transposase Helix-turn-helix domain-containing protein n=1 Tax=Necator americanus TaxID=51031 RepID=A0ABR1E3U5_NECAM
MYVNNYTEPVFFLPPCRAISSRRHSTTATSYSFSIYLASEGSLQRARPARSTVYKWHSKLASGDYFIEDEDRSRRPMKLGLVLLRRQVKADPFQTTRELTVALGMSQTTVVRALKSIGKV